MPIIRTFIALPTSIDVQQKMAAVQSILKSTESDIVWELQDKFHITLKFLGAIEHSNIESLSSILSKSMENFPAFEITYNSLGAFPSINNPRTIWIGTKSNQPVLDLQFSVEQICCAFGFHKEERPFHPHITLGRVKGTHNLDRLTDAIKTVTFEPMQSRCSELLLMKSDLRPSGSIYTILKSFSLQP
jgi:2'-5' RNA ligase